jgi:hypothetical protein
MSSNWWSAHKSLNLILCLERQPFCRLWHEATEWIWGKFPMIHFTHSRKCYSQRQQYIFQNNQKHKWTGEQMLWKHHSMLQYTPHPMKCLWQRLSKCTDTYLTDNAVKMFYTDLSNAFHKTVILKDMSTVVLNVHIRQKFKTILNVVYIYGDKHDNLLDWLIKLVGITNNYGLHSHFLTTYSLRVACITFHLNPFSGDGHQLSIIMFSSCKNT